MIRSSAESKPVESSTTGLAPHEDTSIRSVVSFEREQRRQRQQQDQQVDHFVETTTGNVGKGESTTAGSMTTDATTQPMYDVVKKEKAIDSALGESEAIISSFSRIDAILPICSTNDADVVTCAGDSTSTFGSSVNPKYTTSLDSQAFATNSATIVKLPNFVREGALLIAPGVGLHRREDPLLERPNVTSGMENDIASGLAPAFESNLSLRAMFMHAEDLNQEKEYFADDGNSDTDQDGSHDVQHLKLNDYTPPPSLNANASPIFVTQEGNAQLKPPPVAIPTSSSIARVASFVVGSAASSSTADSLTGNNNSLRQQQPVLYSAIGSLEDPGSSSYKGWKNRGIAAKNPDFPSSMLLAPPAQVASRKKKNALESTLQRRERSKKDHFVAQTSQKQSSRNIVESGQRAGLLKNKTANEEEGSKSATKSDKKVTIASGDLKPKVGDRVSKNPVEMFRPSSDAYTPRMGKKEIKYKPAAMRTPVQQMASPLGTLSRPNFRDALRRVAMIIHQHIVKIERRFEHRTGFPVRNYDGLFSTSMKDAFSEDRYVMPRFKCTMVRVPMARSGMICGLKQIREIYEIPSEGEIYEFAHGLFKTVQLSSECSIVGLIYVERLMEAAKVPLLADTWRPIFMCGLLLASKVWQDLSSWNIEFASVYPQYSLESINRLELQFLRMIKWDLYISSSQYAKYYFALRSLVEKPDFRQRYNRMVGGIDMVQASHARKIEERSTMVKEEALSHLSRSM